MSVLGHLLLSGQDGYQISRSVRLRSSASAYFNRTIAASANPKAWTWSAWVKRGQLGSASFFALYGATISAGSSEESIAFSNDTLRWGDGSAGISGSTTAVFRDTSAWYHVVVVYDSANATAANRLVFYVNGVLNAAAGASITLNRNSYFTLNAGNPVAIGRFGSIASNYFDGYLTEVNFIDGQALTPSSFGETDAVTGVWKPKKYTGTYGTNGFYLNFSDNSNNTAATIGKDYSGNGNNWTPNNISVTSGTTYDSMLDVPTPYADGGNGRGNYCTLNPLLGYSNKINPQDGNLFFYVVAGSNAYFGSRSTLGLSSGKWYWEVTAGAKDSAAGQWMGVGVVADTVNWPSGNGLGANSGGYEYLNDGYKWGNGSASTYGASWTTNDVIGVALDVDAQTLTFYKNGVSQGTAFTSMGSNTAWFPTVEIYRSTGTSQGLFANFGQRPFSYTPPSGFKALNTQNLPDSTIKAGNKYFDVLLHTGNGGTQSVTGTNFQPDLAITKARSQANSHTTYDSVRGATNALFTNTTGAELNYSAYLAGFLSNGVSFIGGGGDTNQTSATYVNWLWKKGATQGFDIVTYTGTGANRTIAHSLGVAPSMLIFKPRNAADNWPVWHKSFAVNEYVYLNLTNAKASLSTFMNSTLPDSSNITLGTWANTNANTQTMVCYAFSEVAGFSKFGSYTGNGSADGPFVYCGFRPRWVMVKRTDSTGNWQILDTARSQFNLSNANLYANLSNAEVNGGNEDMDILSNGWKPRNASASFNVNGGTYIFAAFAENPFKNSLAR